MSTYKRGEEITLEIDATIVEQFDDGSYDVVLDGFESNSPFGFHMCVESKHLKRQ